ncbi:MAG: DUF2950 domain-containing protein [Syntrophus sp. (in: bacteria)]|nr:DUF2950 domain-containing protein [Syntrophus sp. (in: bacteria)]
MNSYRKYRKPRAICCFGLAVLIGFAIILSVANSPAYAAAVKQKGFASPEDAVKAMIGALKTGDRKALIAIFGPQDKNMIFSGDEVADREDRNNMIKRYEEKNRVEKAGDKKAALYVGNEDWPFPVPIVKRGTSWYFSTKEGREEIINRRIGKNELSAIQTCMAYADAQREYALMDIDGDGLNEYAQKLISDSGKKDGLYWETRPGEKPSPMGSFVAAARQEGYTARKPGDNPRPYHGYYYKILTAQGKNAPKGAYSYMVDNKMIGGFALVAYPAQYGVSGIMTFMINQDGTVYEKNLGKKAGKAVQEMKEFNPDTTWRKVKGGE